MEEICTNCNGESTYMPEYCYKCNDRGYVIVNE